MIESYIEEGSQKIGEHVYGKSITDPCLGWEDFKEAYLRHRRNEFLNHKLYTHFFTKHKPQEYISCGLHYFVGLLFNHITISKNCTDCFGILDFPGINHVAQLL